MQTKDLQFRRVSEQACLGAQFPADILCVLCDLTAVPSALNLARCRELPRLIRARQERFAKFNETLGSRIAWRTEHKRDDHMCL
jgi:hypothetical protein